MLDRHIARTGAAPRQTAADGGYASRANLAATKDRGVIDVAFHKKCGIAVADMVKSPWVYRRLRNFRAGIKAAISWFKRAYGGPAAPGAVWITSGLTSGLPWSPTTWCCSPDVNELSRPARDKPAAIGKSGRPELLATRFFVLSLLLQHESAGARTAIRLTPPCYTAEKTPFLDAHC
jgi:hypothetical protein